MHFLPNAAKLTASVNARPAKSHRNAKTALLFLSGVGWPPRLPETVAMNTNVSRRQIAQKSLEPFGTQNVKTVDVCLVKRCAPRFNTANSIQMNKQLVAFQRSSIKSSSMKMNGKSQTIVWIVSVKLARKNAFELIVRC